jgi:hypothetical protein
MMLLFVALGLSMVLLWQITDGGREKPTADGTRPRTPPALVEPDSRKGLAEPAPSPAAGSETFVLPARELPQAPPPPVVPDALQKEIPALPALNESTVSLALIERASEISREFPDEPALQQYVAAAYLLMATKELRARRSNDALRFVDQAESWGTSADQVAAFRAVIYGQEEEWELAEQWARTALAYGARDNAADMHHLIGKAYYFREEMDKAIEEFQIALSLRNDPSIRASLERAVREARASAGFDNKRLSHFIVRYEGETMESTGRMVLDSLERSYATLVSQLGYQPSEPVVVLLYSRRSYREMGGPHWSAGLFDGKIRVPVGGLEQVDEQIRSTLHHELAHAFISARAGQATPRWLHEGLAEYLEGSRGAAQGKLLAQVLNSGKSFEGCLASARCDVRIFYPAATSLVDYLIQNRGMGGIRDVLESLGEGNDIDAALREVLGRDQRELIRDWEHFVKRRYS